MLPISFSHSEGVITPVGAHFVRRIPFLSKLRNDPRQEPSHNPQPTTSREAEKQQPIGNLQPTTNGYFATTVTATNNNNNNNQLQPTTTKQQQSNNKRQQPTTAMATCPPEASNLTRVEAAAEKKLGTLGT